jgi:catechol 2,3-dioxygenase-like lactoylglutathione lyase family enzyme
MWKRRLRDRGHRVTGPYFRNYFNAIYFNDPDGAIFEIATTEPGFGHDEEILGSAHMAPPDEAVHRGEREVAAESAPEPHAEISADMTLRGFHHNTSVSSDIEAMTDFFVNRVGVDLIKMTDYLDAENATHYYYSAIPEPAPGHVLTYFGFPGYPTGRLGAGLSHHIALTARDDEALAAWRDAMISAGVEVGEIEDERYFRSAAFRDPDGHLYRIATPPDFTIDEPADALGSKLCLPEELEGRRDEIEEGLRLRPAPTPKRTAAA